MKNRNHPISIINIKYSFLILSVLLFFVIFFESSKKWVFYLVIASVASLFVLFFLLRILMWYKTNYEVTNDKIIYNRFMKFTVFNVTMNIDNISSINASANLLYRILQVSRVSITSNTGVGNADDSIDLIISNSQYQQLKEALEKDSSTKEASSEVVKYRYNFIDVLYFLLISVIIPGVIVVIFSFLLFNLLKIKFNLNTVLLDFDTILFSLELLVPVSLYKFIEYKRLLNLQVVFDRLRSKVIIKSYLLSESEIEFDYQQVKVLKLYNYTLFKKYFLKVGIVNSLETSNEATVIPFLSALTNRQKIESILNDLKYSFSERLKYRPSKVRLLYIVIQVLIYVLILVIIFFIGITYLNNPFIWLPFALATFVGILRKFLKIFSHFKTEYIAFDEKNIIVATDYYLHKKFVFDYDNVQMVTITQNPLDKLFKVANVYINIFSYNVQEKTVYKLEKYRYKKANEILKHIESKINYQNNIRS